MELPETAKNYCLSQDLTSWIAVRPPSENPETKRSTMDPTDRVWYIYDRWRALGAAYGCLE